MLTSLDVITCLRGTDQGTGVPAGTVVAATIGVISAANNPTPPTGKQFFLWETKVRVKSAATVSIAFLTGAATAGTGSPDLDAHRALDFEGKALPTLLRIARLHLRWSTAGAPSSNLPTITPDSGTAFSIPRDGVLFLGGSSSYDSIGAAWETLLFTGAESAEWTTFDITALGIYTG